VASAALHRARRPASYPMIAPAPANLRSPDALATLIAWTSRRWRASCPRMAAERGSHRLLRGHERAAKR